MLLIDGLSVPQGPLPKASQPNTPQGIAIEAAWIADASQPRAIGKSHIITAVEVDNPPVEITGGPAQVDSTVSLSWQLDPAAWEFISTARAPFMPNNYRVFPVIVNNPPVTSTRTQEQVNATWQQDPAAFEFFGGVGPFMPSRVPASALAVLVNNPPVVLIQGQRPYDNWWIPADPAPQLTVKKAQGPPPNPANIPAPSTWTILSAWNPPDAQAPIAGKINPVFLAIAVNNPPVSSNAENQLAAGGFWPALPDPNPTLPRYLPASVTAVVVNLPPISSTADNQLDIGGFWPILPDPNPTLRPLLPAVFLAVAASTPPPVSSTANSQAIIGGSWPVSPVSGILRRSLSTTAVAVNNPPTASNADNQLVGGGFWFPGPDPNPTLPPSLIISSSISILTPSSVAALYETVISSWTTPDPQVLPGKLNPAFLAAPVSNPPLAGLSGSRQQAAGGYWPPLPDPLPILRPFLPVAVTGAIVSIPPPTELGGANQLAAGGYWPALPDPNPTLPRYLPVAITAVVVNNPPSTQSNGANQLASSGGYWPALPDPNPVLPRYLPATVTAARVDNPAPSSIAYKLGAVVWNIWESVKVTVVFGNQVISSGPSSRIDQPPIDPKVNLESVLRVWDAIPPQLIAITAPPVAAPFIPPVSGQPFGNAAGLQVFASFGPIPTSLTWLQLPDSLLNVRVDNPPLIGPPVTISELWASWLPTDPQPILPRLPIKPFVPVVQLISEVLPLETIIASWQPPDPLPQRGVRNFTVGVPNPPAVSHEAEVLASWQANRESWLDGTPAPVVARPLNPAISASRVDNPPVRISTDQVGISVSWIPPEPWTQKIAKLNPNALIVRVDNPPFAGAAPKNQFGTIGNAWVPPDVLPQRLIQPLFPVLVVPSASSLPGLLASVYATWIVPDVAVQPRLLLPQASAGVLGGFVPRSASSPSLLNVLGAWADIPVTIAPRTYQVQGTAVFLPSTASPPSPFEVILNYWAPTDLPPIVARLQVPPTQIGGQNARTSNQVSTVLAAWQDGPPLIVAQRYLPSGTAAVVVSPAIMTGTYLVNLMTVLSFWVPSAFDPWFTGFPTGQPLPPPVALIQYGKGVSEALGAAHELGSALRQGLGALSRS